MSFYEMEAEKEGHFFMAHGEVAMKPHFHSAPEFIFVQSGVLEAIVGGEKKILLAGEGCFCQPFCVHSYTETSPAVCFAVVGDRKYFEHSFASLGGLIPPRFFQFSDFELLSFLFGRFKEKTGNDGGRVALNEGIASLLVHALSQNLPFESSKTDKQNLLVCEVLKYAHEHLEDDLSLGNLAKIFGYSNRHLSRMLKRNLSQKWNDYTHLLRVRKAHDLLQENPHLSVLDVALSCGFESSNTFYRAYKKVYQVAPRREK